MVTLIAKNQTIECELVIFDKNGTLVNQHLLLLELAKARKNAVQKFVGKNVSELWEKIVGVDLKNGKIDHSGPLGTAPRREEILIVAAAFYLNGYSWSEAKQLAQRVYDEADDSMQSPYGSVLLEGVAETLKRLKQGGLKLAIASTDTHRRTVESFKTLKIAHFFDAMVGSDDVVNGKPSPDMVLEILKKTETKPSATVIVGDSLSDMQMGRNAKLKACIGVLTGFTPKEKLEQLADVVVFSISELHVH
ncbi:MAG: HAD family hydrolase [Candidatus Bathyarchaeota archaeon]|nr:HAD family hydrolase [Candidatus Bathyarchaeota archaeon]